MVVYHGCFVGTQCRHVVTTGSTLDTAAGDAHWHVTEWDTTTTWPKVFDIKVDS